MANGDVIVGPQGQRIQDTVPPTPTPNPAPNPQVIQMTDGDFRALNNDMLTMQETARRIESAAKNIAKVAERSTVMLTRTDKLMVGAACLVMVGVGVGGTLAVQSIRRGRAARSMTVTTVK